jgi:hypothetical protein
VVIYDPVQGELRVHARAKWEVVLYRTQFGLCLFDHMEFFPNAAKYTLKPLREQGAASLHCQDVRGLVYVQLKEVHLSWGGKHKEVQIHRALNVFEALKLRQTEMPEKPLLVRATFAVRFADGKDARLVTISPPNTALYAHEEDAHLVDQWLALRGFVKGPGGSATSKPGEDDGQGGSLLASA